jgi:hypothetical protein
MLVSQTKLPVSYTAAMGLMSWIVIWLSWLCSKLPQLRLSAAA